ncbi:GntR family transcriptional regulator [Blastococcus xanthinilyticus]|uniref:GntR family transcriptional regulator n=1 Tax=Blastococcus xanthinilyticus TaxID=1564164 RepID=UPI001AA176D6|nr:GntR family transcriptional regulator [Blastococcus xanthinilyticus]
MVETPGIDGFEPPRPGRGRLALSEESASYVRALIMSGELREGEFVRLDRIAADLGISVTPAREGLLLLRGEGFVVSEPRRGFVVAPLSPDDVADLFFVQATIAGELAARAARRLSDADLAEVDHLQDQLARAARAGDGDVVVRCNHLLHRKINQVAAAPKLNWFLGVSVRYVPTRFFTSIAGWEEAAAHDHAALIEALHRRDPDAARTAMEQHIRHAGELLVAHLVRTRAAIRDGLAPAREAPAAGSPAAPPTDVPGHP